MLDVLLVLVEGDDIGDGLFLTLIVTDDELQFDTHRRASPGSSGRRRVHAILPDFGGFPQHLHALLFEQYRELRIRGSPSVKLPKSSRFTELPCQPGVSGTIRSISATLSPSSFRAVPDWHSSTDS